MLNRIYILLAFVLLLIPVEGRLFAEEKVATGKFVVSLTAEDDQKAWVVKALEQNIYNDLSGYARVVPFTKIIEEEDKCEKRNVNCILEIYKKLKVAAVMLGTVDKGDIDYEIYDIENKSLVKSGSIEIGRDSSLLKMRLGAFNAFKPFIAKGGILDKRQYDALAAAQIKESDDKKSQETLNFIIKNQILIFLAGFTCFPYILSFLGKPLRHPERTKIVLHWFYPFQIVSVLIIAYQFILTSTTDGNILSNILSLFDGYHWVLTGFSGVFWGYFIIINFKIVMPHLQGIERIKPSNIFTLLHSCFLILIIKSLIVGAFYYGYFYGVLYAGKLFSMKQDDIIIYLFPIAGLYIFYWMGLMLDVFSMSIDVKLSGRRLDYNNVWDFKIRKYFISYLKRNGVTLNKRLIDEIVFLPGENKGVLSYGGGFSRPRITIERNLIKFALGDIAEQEHENIDKSVPKNIGDASHEDTEILVQKTIEPVKRQNSVFQLIPNLSPQNTAKKMFQARQDKKRIRYLERAQQFYQRDLKLQLGNNNIQVESIMQGLVIPRLETDGDVPSLMSDNVDDMKIVQALLLENSGDKSRYNDDAEIDDSSEENKDFLFGALLHRLGGILRHDDIFSTIQLYFRYKKANKKGPYNYFFSKYFAVLADTFVVLNFGLNHLMQYLYFQSTKDKSLLTIKGLTSRMLKSQAAILTTTKKEIDENKRKIIQTDEFERITWISRFCQDPIKKKEKKTSKLKMLYKFSMALGVAYLASLVVMNSYNYHPRYVAMIEQEKQDIADAIKEQLEKEEKEKEEAAGVIKSKQNKTNAVTLDASKNKKESKAKKNKVGEAKKKASKSKKKKSSSSKKTKKKVTERKKKKSSSSKKTRKKVTKRKKKKSSSSKKTRKKVTKRKKKKSSSSKKKKKKVTKRKKKKSSSSKKKKKKVTKRKKKKSSSSKKKKKKASKSKKKKSSKTKDE